MVDDEVQVGPILGGLFEIERPARFFVEGAQGQALMNAEILDSKCFGLFPEGVGDLLVVHSPGFLADLGAGVHLPGFDLQVLDLALHLLELGLAQVGPSSPCERTRREPARSLTNLRVATI